MIKIIELFAGYGGASLALKQAGVKHELIGYSEIDKFAIQTFEQNHKSRLGNLGNIVDIDFKQFKGDVNLITGGSPCQDFSYAGKRAGTHNEDGSLTRSGLVWEYIRAIEESKPEYFIWENVGGTLTAKNEEGELVLDLVKKAFSDLGYTVKMEVLYGNKHGGVPQSRPRIVGVGIRNDVDKVFEFPSEIPLTYTIQDLIESKVDSKYFLTDEQVTKIIARTHEKKGTPLVSHDEFNKFVKTRAEKRRPVDSTDTLLYSPWSNYADSWCSPTIVTGVGGTIGIGCGIWILPDGRWRKMTPTETFGLMGVFGLKTEGLSNTQLFRQAGNGWIVPVFTRVFQNLLVDSE